MDIALYKSGVLLAHQLMDSLLIGDEQGSFEALLALASFYVDYSLELDALPEFAAVRDCLLKLTTRLSDNKQVSMREYNALRQPLTKSLEAWVKKVRLRLHIRQDALKYEPFFVNRNIKSQVIDGDLGVIPDCGEGEIGILLTGDYSDLDDVPEGISGIISVQDLHKRARLCYTIDGFDYDRLYLSGKLKSLMCSRKNTSIILGGSSYAMVGLREHLMPRPATNLAVNAQDPYYAFRSVTAAKERCKAINTAVIVGGYYFWHTDMSYNPSDYYKSVLLRTNYPIFKDLHNYTGETEMSVHEDRRNPLLEEIFDLKLICENEDEKISAELAPLEYYNPEFNPRPKHGMLMFPFRKQSDVVNDKSAKARAEAHNRNFNLGHLENNINLLADFLKQMESAQVRAIFIIPPTTGFYRKHSAPELRESLYGLLEPVKSNFNLEFIDLFDSPDFENIDFQDYDHLNNQGAEKLSKIVAGII